MATKGIPSVPDIPFELKESDIYRILEPLARIINIRQGKFDPLDRWVTQQDLVDAGIQSETAVESPIVVVPPTVQYDFQLTGDIIGGPTIMASGDPLIQMATIINLPNVTGIDGGDSASTYPGDPQGPYGVSGGGGGGGTGLPNGGLEGDLLVKQSATDGDADWVTPGGSTAGEAYCPNYTSYTRQSDSTFTIDLVNAESLFRPGRRVRFTQGAADTFGTITAVDYNSTHANDTFVTLTMEGTDTIPTGTFDVCLVTSGTSWSAIAADPFSGDKIWDIATGVLSGTQWWVIVGTGGKLYTSTDGGVTWTSRTSGTTGNIKAVTYSGVRAKFYIGGVNSAGTDFYFAESTNGTTWTDLSSNALLPTWATGDEIVRLWTDYFQDWLALQWFDSSAGNYPIVVTGDDFVTNAYTKAGSNYNCGGFDESPAADGSIHWRCSGSTPGYYTFLSDTAVTNQTAFASTGAGMLYSYMASGPAADQWLVAGCTGGQIYSFVAGGGQTLEDTVGSDAVRFFAHSATHDRIVAAGDNGFLAYIGEADLVTADAWTTVSNGLEPTANFTGVEYNETDGVFVAIADNGQILRSSNGTN